MPAKSKGDVLLILGSPALNVRRPLVADQIEQSKVDVLQKAARTQCPNALRR
jgi:hypothetical protein